jgi:hypothetical protein
MDTHLTLALLSTLTRQGSGSPTSTNQPLMETQMQNEEHNHEIGGELSSPVARRVRTEATTLVFTVAQNNTKLHERFWQSLMRFVEYKQAELHIARITYVKAMQGSAKPGTKKWTDDDRMWYDPRITPYISDQAVQVAPDLVWCGELNIIPTRVDPLSNLLSYTRNASGIVPHVKMGMKSVPTMKGHDRKFMYTTGTVTQRNYIQKAAGQIAEFHHVFGAVIVEVDADGRWWARQINADTYGVFYDKTTRYSPEGVSHGWPVEAMVHGDIHIGKANNALLDTVFMAGGVVDQLRPKHQFFHDLVDFTPRNHHNIDDPHYLWSKEAQKSVESEFDAAAMLLHHAERSWSTSHVVVSNHDTAISRWLRNTVAFWDAKNVKYWLEMNQYVIGKLHHGEKPHPFLYALQRARPGQFHLIDEDESFRIHDVEFGLHGHLGPNGSRGSPKNLSAIGKACTAHTHSAGIIEGVYTTGVYGNLDMGYNKGPSSWSHAFVVQYANGKRAIYTFNGLMPWRNYENV